MALAEHTRTFSNGKVFSADDLEAELLVLFSAINGGIGGDNLESIGGAFDMDGKRITGLGTPSASTDAVTKDYADTLINNVESNIITAAERAKLEAITDTGSGIIISDAERTKLTDIDVTRGNFCVGSSGAGDTENDVEKLDAMDISGDGSLFLNNAGAYSNPNLSALSAYFKIGQSVYIQEWTGGTHDVDLQTTLNIDTSISGGLLLMTGFSQARSGTNGQTRAYCDKISTYSPVKFPYWYQLQGSDPIYQIETRSQFLVPFEKDDTYLHIEVQGDSPRARLYGYIFLPNVTVEFS